MPVQKARKYIKNAENSIAVTAKSLGNTANLLENVAKELYQKNLQLLREEGRLNEILASVREVIFAINQNHEITLFNHRAEEIFEAKKNEAINQKAKKFIRIYTEGREAPLKPSEYAFKSSDFSIDRVTIVNHLDKRSYFNLKSTFVDFGEGKKESVIALSNVTHEVELEKQKDDFISMASHELKTPISVVSNSLWMYRNSVKRNLNKREQKFLKDSEEGLNRLSNIINNLLDISRMQQGRLMFNIQKHNLYELVMTSINNISGLAEEKEISFKEPRKTDAIVKTDATKFQEILGNLLSNAVKYGKKGKMVIKIEKEAHYYKISVKDTGPGIKKKDYDKLFTRFGRATEGLKLTSAGSSTGLGLYIAKQFTKELGGDIGFTSQKGKGSTFWFTIPNTVPQNMKKNQYSWEANNS